MNLADSLNLGCMCRTLNPERLREQLECDPQLAGLAQQLGATHPHLFSQTAVFLDPATRDALWRERSTQRLLEIQARMDVAVFGLGSPFAEVPSQVYIGGYLDAVDYRSLSADGVVGDVATVFYRGDGTFDGIALNARASGPGLDRLRRVARRVGIVSGVQKLPSLRGALAAGLITDLVLDESLATALVAGDGEAATG